MFGGEDDDDFTPNPSSKLASLFGFGKSSDEGNTSLTYTAPKQPKKGRGESQISKGQETGQTTSSPAKLSIVIVKAVHTYKLAEGNYNAQGKLGAAVLGNATTRVYQLLLYKGKQQHVTSCRITPQFQFVVQPNNYATFYDDQTQNWSIMFETSEDAIEFAREVGLARGNAAKDPSEYKLLTQDLLFGVGSGAGDGDMVEVRYIVYPMSDGKLGQEMENTTQTEKPLRVKLKKESWEEGLLGAAKGCKRMIMLTPALTGPWRSQVPHDTGVMVQVDMGRIKSSRTDSGESTDDTSIRARGASISEALSNSPKTHKASIISRMARMGQATLPLKGAIPCNPSDSEETEEDSNVVNKAPTKVRVTKSRPAAEKPVPSMMIPPQQVALYQQLSVPWQQTQAPQPPQQHQFVRANGSMTYVQPSYPLQTVSTPQMFPVSTPPAVPSPDSHLSVFLAETRTQNSEVRMGIAKVADKVDQVLIKLDTMQQVQHRRESSTGMIEPSSLLVSIQKLVNDNETLKLELEEKRNRIDQLYSMLHSNMMESRNDSLVFTLQQEKAQLSADLGEARSRTSSLEMLVTSRGEELVSNKQLVKDQEQKLAVLQQELNNCKQRITDIIKTHEDEMKKLEHDTVGKVEHATNLEQENAALKEKISNVQEQQKKTEHDVVGHVEYIRNLEQEITALKEKIRDLQTEKTSAPSSVNEVKKVMNVVYHQTAALFSADTSYTGHKIKQILMNTIRDVTLKYLEVQSRDDSKSVQREKKRRNSETLVQNPPTQTCESEKVKSSKKSVPLVKEEENIKKIVQDSVKVQKEETKEEKAENPQKPTALERLKVDNVASDLKTNEPEVPVSTDNHELEKAQHDKEFSVPSNPKVEEAKNSLQFKTQDDSENGKASSADILKDENREDKDIVQSSTSEGCEIAHSVPEIKKKESYIGTEASNRLKVENISSSEQSSDHHEEKKREENKSTDISQANKEKQSRDSSLERSWRPQPPPPPLFDDDDDDDDWLS